MIIYSEDGGPLDLLFFEFSHTCLTQDQAQLIAAIERAGMSRVSNGLPPSHAFDEPDADSSLEIALAASLELVWCSL